MSAELTELPDGWELVRIENIAKVGTGATPLKSKVEYYESGTVPWVTSGLLNDLFISEVEEKITELAVQETNAKVFPRNTLLVAMYGEGKTRGKVSELLIEAATNQACAGLIFEGIASEIRPYVKIFLEKNYDNIRRLSSGGVQPNLNLGIIKTTEVPFAPLNEQRRIVAKIEELRDRHQRAKQALEAIPELCDRFRQSVLAAAFRGDLTADWREENPDVEPASVLLERTSKELKQDLTQITTEIDRDNSDLPASWTWAKFKLFVKGIQAGKNFACPEVPVTKDTIGLVKISAVTWGKFDPQETKTVDDPSKVDTNLFIQTGDFLISRANTIELVGASVVVDEINHKIMLSDKVWRVNFLEVDKRFINFYLKSLCGRREIESRATGNQLSMRNISQNAFKDIVVALPPLEEQQEIVCQIEALFKGIDLITQQYQDSETLLDRLNQSILAKAFRGEIVEQDPNDEPASVLLERIRAEREQEDNGKKTKGKRIRQLKLEV